MDKKYRSKKKRRRLRIDRFILLLAILFLLASISVALLYAFVDALFLRSYASPKATPTALATQKPVPQVTSVPTATPSATIDPSVFTDLNSMLLVANKKHPLPTTYIPSDLETIDGPTLNGAPILMRSEAAKAFKAMLVDSQNAGLQLQMVSGFRSYESQQLVYNDIVSSDGQTKADEVSSRPGYSEHQTGLAIDVATIGDNQTQLVESFEATQEGQWLRQNAQQYGFIIRYPKDKEGYTGYTYEPWHLRYVGVEYAKKITQSNLCFEEYFQVDGGDY